MPKFNKVNRTLTYHPAGQREKTWPDREDLPPDLPPGGPFEDGGDAGPGPNPVAPSGDRGPGSPATPPTSD